MELDGLAQRQGPGEGDAERPRPVPGGGERGLVLAWAELIAAAPPQKDTDVTVASVPSSDTNEAGSKLPEVVPPG